MQSKKQLNYIDSNFSDIVDLNEEAIRLMGFGMTEEEIMVVFDLDGVESNLARRAVSAALTHKVLG